MKLKRTLKYNYFKILRLQEEPKQVAMSVALGTSIMFMPFFGFGIFIAYFAAMLLKVNKIATILTTLLWKLALPVFYVLNYMTGNFVMGAKHIPSRHLHDAVGFMGRFNAIGTPFLVGSAINSILAGILAYYLALKLLTLRKERKNASMMHRKKVKEEV